MDGESFDNELFNDLSRDVKLQQIWQRHHLMNEVMHDDTGEVLTRHRHRCVQARP
ncbi:RseA family anti-sigma factor [Sodalis sp.]|uniref:RseA family anti-sigma factor n=1 Tax=Sodalis sp. (in: enterobacteria) TaxID=1898979 RepID=UPI0038738D5D